MGEEWKKNWGIYSEQWLFQKELFYNEYRGSHSAKLKKLKQKYFKKKLKKLNDHEKMLWEYFHFIYGNKLIIHADILQRFLFFSLPNEKRGSYWCNFIGLSDKKKEIDEIPYGYLLFHYFNTTSLSILEIKRDIHRSLPEHPFYQDTSGLNSLESVLSAYSWRNSSIGYCQSMNIIAALLLLFLSEEDSYSVLSIICGSFTFFIPLLFLFSIFVTFLFIKPPLAQYLPCSFPFL